MNGIFSDPAGHALAAALQKLLDTVGEVCPELAPEVMEEGRAALKAYSCRNG